MFARGPGRSDNSDYYNILGVSKTSSPEDIKKAFRRAAIKHHPDKGGDPDKFKELSQAYEILSDPNKRNVYDQYGEDGLKEGLGDGRAFNPFDLLGAIFTAHNGGPAFGGSNLKRGGRNVKRGNDIVHPLEVSLEDLYNGGKKNLSVSRHMLCPKCKGNGSKSGASRSCAGCHGRGVTFSRHHIGPCMVQQTQHVCSNCNGSGESISPRDRCLQCKGNKVIQSKKVLKAYIEKGMQDGQKIVFKGQANEARGVKTGDIVIMLKLKDHPKFKRKADDLFVDHRLTLTEALCGFQFALTHLDERQLLIKTNPGEVIKPGQFKCINHEGMPQYQTPFLKGSLYIQFHIKFPESGTISPEQCRALVALLPFKELPKLRTMDLDECEETKIYDVDMEVEMKKKQHQKCAEAYEEDDDIMGNQAECAQQ